MSPLHLAAAFISSLALATPAEALKLCQPKTPVTQARLCPAKPREARELPPLLIKPVYRPSQPLPVRPVSKIISADAR